LGTGQYADPTIARDGTLAFAALTLERAIERVSLGDDQPRNVERLYSDGEPVALRASSTRDGSLIAFERNIQTAPIRRSLPPPKARSIDRTHHLTIAGLPFDNRTRRL
jgi:hypothetical protein